MSEAYTRRNRLAHAHGLELASPGQRCQVPRGEKRQHAPCGRTAVYVTERRRLPVCPNHHPRRCARVEELDRS
jgi:hypothetical protein